jgi:hypothetical protein
MARKLPSGQITCCCFDLETTGLDGGLGVILSAQRGVRIGIGNRYAPANRRRPSGQRPFWRPGAGEWAARCGCAPGPASGRRGRRGEEFMALLGLTTPGRLR